MSIFKRKLSLDEIIEAYEKLAPEDKEKLLKAIDKKEEAEEVEEVKEETTETTEAIEEDKAEETTEAEAESEAEEVAETEAKEEIAASEETETEPTVENTDATAEEPQEQESTEDLDAAKEARILALEEKLAKLEQLMEGYAEKDKNGDFGLNPQAPAAKHEEKTQHDAVLRGYAGRDAYKYQ